MPNYRTEELSKLRPTGRIFVSSNRRILPGNESRIALRCPFLATKTAFYPVSYRLRLRKIEKFCDFIIGHKLSHC
ncbi:hypothetical protein EGH57_04620 [Klebsiella aerogenes]|nr:hypothetical protein DNK66_05685 [Klebsiella aerogenes]RSV92641.1 hypothetical protein EGH57_04620 [Klebsiella aerogenes]RSW48323.1 hypothetical protein EGH44_14240 [Klebsiella aerogenes]